MNLRIITKNHGADPEIRFIKKSILKPYGPYGMAAQWRCRQRGS